jgi:hypothetical protein
MHQRSDHIADACAASRRPLKSALSTADNRQGVLRNRRCRISCGFRRAGRPIVAGPWQGPHLTAPERSYTSSCRRPTSARGVQDEAYLLLA